MHNHVIRVMKILQLKDHFLTQITWSPEAFCRTFLTSDRVLAPLQQRFREMLIFSDLYNSICEPERSPGICLLWPCFQCHFSCPSWRSQPTSALSLAPAMNPEEVGSILYSQKLANFSGHQGLYWSHAHNDACICNTSGRL